MARGGIRSHRHSWADKWAGLAAQVRGWGETCSREATRSGGLWPRPVTTAPGKTAHPPPQPPANRPEPPASSSSGPEKEEGFGDARMGRDHPRTSGLVTGSLDPGRGNHNGGGGWARWSPKPPSSPNRGCRGSASRHAAYPARGGAGPGHRGSTGAGWRRGGLIPTMTNFQ